MGKHWRAVLAGVVVLGWLAGVAPLKVSAETLADPIALQATVAIGYWFEVTDRFGTRRDVVSGGSGALISEDGLILTNYHVVHQDLNALAIQLEQMAEYWGYPADYTLIDPTPVISLPDDRGFVTPAYLAQVADESESLDVAVLRIVSTSSGTPVRSGALALPFLSLGDSDAIGIGDPLTVYGYPVIWGSALSLSSGIVSGFEVDWDNSAKYWIKTDAGISGGNSGGAAIDSNGALIGIPTRASNLDCRPSDTNFDGELDELDGCVPVGSAIGYLRPINDVRSIISRAETALPASMPTKSPTAAPTPTREPTVVPTTVQSSWSAACSRPVTFPDKFAWTAPRTTVYLGPAPSAPTVSFLQNTQLVRLIGMQVGSDGCRWYNVNVIDENLTGYVRQDFLTPAS